LKSALYAGRVRHRRFEPVENEFSYPVLFHYLDLGELEEAFAVSPFYGLERPNLISFRRADYHGDPARPLADCVRESVAAKTGRRPAGPIRLLSHLRSFGHSFNPVSFYYCFASDGVTLEAILAEITNTPWKERHTYVLPAPADGRLEWSFGKEFHVSPFMPMEIAYRWVFNVPASKIGVHMENTEIREGSKRCFDATLTLERREWNSGNLLGALLRYPAMTLWVVFWIHFQALKLWLKRSPVHTHPSRR
jgi:DUF1365 family protein